MAGEDYNRNLRFDPLPEFSPENQGNLSKNNSISINSQYMTLPLISY